MSLSFKLVRPAKSKGGDRYEAKVEGEEKPWVVYFPQSICREKGVPAYEIAITVDVYNE